MFTPSLDILLIFEILLHVLYLLSAALQLLGCDSYMLTIYKRGNFSLLGYLTLKLRKFKTVAIDICEIRVI